MNDNERAEIKLANALVGLLIGLAFVAAVLAAALLS